VCIPLYKNIATWWPKAEPQNHNRGDCYAEEGKTRFFLTNMGNVGSGVFYTVYAKAM
jgi:hypothetical protein